MRARQAGTWRRIAVAGVTAGLLLLSTASAFVVSASSGTMTITKSTTLTVDHVGNIVIEADNVTLDCAGHSVSGDGTGAGILLDGRSGVTVTNCRVTGFGDGISVQAVAGPSSHNSLIANTVSGTATSGFLVIGSSSDMLAGNSSSGSGYWGFLVKSSTKETLSSNTATRGGVLGVRARLFAAELPRPQHRDAQRDDRPRRRLLH